MCSGQRHKAAQIEDGSLRIAMPALSITAGPSLSAAVALLRAAELPTEDLTESHLQHFFMASSPVSVVGLVGLELHGRHALLRSLVVHPNVRAKRIGSELIDHAEA